tara:strand:+ start:7832 stop:7951 length:120 start_codon:yes stop_codon:yes gene_type:complete
MGFLGFRKDKSEGVLIIARYRAFMAVIMYKKVDKFGLKI